MNTTPNLIIDRKEIYKAQKFAFEAHDKEGQRYGRYDYTKHLSDIKSVLLSHNYIHTDFLVTGYLHDTLEDCDVTKDEIESQFGIDILNNVIALTKLPNGEPNYQMLKMKKVAKAVKLIDSYVNLGQGIIERNKKSEKYVKRFPKYRAELYVKGEFENLWLALEKQISIYKAFVL